MAKKIVKILCKKCKTETNHTLEWSKTDRWGTEDIQGKDVSEILICNGCDAITYRILSSNSEDLYRISEHEWDYDVTIKYYPQRGYDMIEPIFEIWNAPFKIRKIYRETIDAFNNNQLILCSIGIRGIIEAFCIEKGIKKRTLELKIDELGTKGIITSTLCEGLHESRIMGNGGAHQLEIFDKEELKTAISLINRLIDDIYSLPEKVKELKKRSSKFKKK